MEQEDQHEILRKFIIGYIIAGHTTTDEALNWISKQVDDFLEEWEHGLLYGFCVPLVSCMEYVKLLDDPNDYKDLFTLSFYLNRFLRTFGPIE